jgi:putative endonuclease
LNPSREQLGQLGESEAEAYLCRHKLRLIERNYRCRSGEIDLVMLDPNDTDIEVVAFIEVRLRGRGARSSGLDSVDENKQRRLITTARHFLQNNPQWQQHPCRFDVVALSPENEKLVWLTNAFEAI